MNDEHDQAKPDRPAIPAWIAPILQREADESRDSDRRLTAEGQGRADAINDHLAYLGIVPRQPARWVPDVLVSAVLLEPGEIEEGELGVRVGWADDDVALFVYDPNDQQTSGEYYVGRLTSAQDAANARFGSLIGQASYAPPDHEQLAEGELRHAALGDVDDADPFDAAFLSGIRGLAHAVLALNDTVSRLGVRQALRQAAALGEIPLDQVGVTAEEKRLLRELFPPASADTAQTDQAHSALDGT